MKQARVVMVVLIFQAFGIAGYFGYQHYRVASNAREAKMKSEKADKAFVRALTNYFGSSFAPNLAYYSQVWGDDRLKKVGNLRSQLFKDRANYQARIKTILAMRFMLADVLNEYDKQDEKLARTKRAVVFLEAAAGALDPEKKANAMKIIEVANKEYEISKELWSMYKALDEKDALVDDVYKNPTFGPVELNRVNSLQNERDTILGETNDKETLLDETHSDLGAYWSLLATQLDVPKPEIVRASDAGRF